MDIQNYGLIRTATSTASLLQIPIPKLRDDYILVRTVAIALNPTDWTTLDARGDDGTLVGCDYSGVVLEVGKAVAKSWTVGDRVAGFGHGGKFCASLPSKSKILRDRELVNYRYLY
jgi:NADPH:quinone reductase-like Zn-dependent oxidoreductase